MKSEITKTIFSALLVSTCLVQPAEAEDSTFFGTTTNYLMAPARYARKAIFMPFNMFAKGSTHEVMAVKKQVIYEREATLGAGPDIVVTTNDGLQGTVRTTRRVNPPLFVTTGATITNFQVYLPNDLLTRRDDLIARIYTEKALGKLSDSQASVLLDEVQTVAAMPFPTSMERTTAEARQVKMIYRNFDKVANDIFLESKQGDKQLAGRYSYIPM